MMRAVINMVLNAERMKTVMITIDDLVKIWDQLITRLEQRNQRAGNYVSLFD